jgi:hypothetical protein
MADSLNSANPIAAAGGFAGRSGGQQPSQAKPRPARSGAEAAPADAVELSAAPVRQLLRERILARTRTELGLAASASHGPAFAEAIDSESVTAFVGRLLSAQNQLAAAAGLSGPNRREALDRAFREGAAEAHELLGDAGGALLASVCDAHGARIGCVAVADAQLKT